MKDWKTKARQLTEKMRHGYLVVEELISLLGLKAMADEVRKKLNVTPTDKLILICYHPGTRREHYEIQPYSFVGEALSVKLFREPDVVALAAKLNPAIATSALETEAIA